MFYNMKIPSHGQVIYGVNSCSCNKIKIYFYTSLLVAIKHQGALLDIIIKTNDKQLNNNN